MRMRRPPSAGAWTARTSSATPWRTTTFSGPTGRASPTSGRSSRPTAPRLASTARSRRRPGWSWARSYSRKGSAVCGARSAPPAQIRDLIRGYQAAGVDQLVFVSQAGRTRHEHICESLELFAREVMPEFAEQADEHDRDKAERLAGAGEAALARRDPPRTPPADYTTSGAMQF